MSDANSINDPKATTWNSEEFLNQYEPLKANLVRRDRTSYDKIRVLRAKEYRNTVDIVSQGYYMTEAGSKVKIEGSEEMTNNTRFYSSPFVVSDITPVGYTDVKVVNKDCLEEAVQLIDDGYNPAVLNMASGSNPGGGVVNGAGAQEETLFRRTNLFRSLYQYASYADLYGIEKSENQYPLDRNFGGIYTPNATLFREDESKGYKLMDNPCKISFISVSGVNRPELDEEGLIASHVVETVKNKMRTILRIGLYNGHDSLVLGALGCGAYCNPPRHIAHLFHEVMNEREFAHKYLLIAFAILEDHNSHRNHNREGNYKPFVEEFKDKR